MDFEILCWGFICDVCKLVIGILVGWCLAKQRKKKVRIVAVCCNQEWEENGLLFKEIIRQEYNGNNCIISGGFVEGNNKPQVDTIYLRLEKDGVEPTVLLLRPDEMQSLAWIASGVIWSHLMNEKGPD